MSKRISILAAAVLIISSAVFVAAQTTTTTVTQTPTKVTKTVQNPDGTYTVIEYPVGKEVQLTLTPVSLTKSKAVGTILRDDTGTKVILNLTDVPADVSAINVYAVDDAGVITSLGPVVLANGTGKFSTTTPLSKFMLIAAPDTSLTAYDPNAKIYFRSAVPEGFSVIPRTTVAAGVTTPTTVTTTPATVTTTPATVTTTPATVTTPTTVTTTPTTVTKTVQNPDGTYTVIEYPVGKETIVTLNPVTIPGAAGTATILRDDDGTRIKLNLTGLPNDLTTLNLYAVDAAGIATSLGPITVNNGLGTFTTTTPLDKFMLIASPESGLTSYNPNTKLFFRSAVPSGFAVIPIARTGEGPGAARGEKVSAAASPYSIAMLGIPSLPAKKETTLHVNFAESAKATRTQIFITPNFNNSGKTRVKAKFHELSGVAQGAFLTLWAVGPDGSFTRLGSTTNTGHPNVATIDTDRNKTNVALSDFGLFLTTEPTAAINAPSGPVLVRIIR